MDAFIYQYLVGGIIFAIGLVYGFRQEYFGTKGVGLRNLIVVFAGLFFFAGVQSYLQYAPMEEQSRYVVLDESGQPKTKEAIIAADYPASKFRSTKSSEEITKIQSRKRNGRWTFKSINSWGNMDNTYKELSKSNI